MKKIAVYGSLKKGKYNHSLLNGSIFIGDTTIKGTLYRVSSYPAIVDEGGNEYPAEIYEVPDDVFKYVQSMELGAGYKEVEVDGAIVYYAGTRLAEYVKNNCEVINEY